MTTTSALQPDQAHADAAEAQDPASQRIGRPLPSPGTTKGPNTAKPRRMGINGLIRHVVPSISRLTYNPAVKAFLGLFDVVPRLMFEELRDLPPNYMRVRVGVENRVFANHLIYLERGKDLWLYAFAEGMCGLDSTIVEIGCGCGRRTHHLRDLKVHSERFTGKYVGIDIDEEMLAWCREHFDAQRFQFLSSTHDSRSYVNRSATDAYYTVPLEDGSVDFVLATSLLTHLLEEQMTNYFRESARMLKPGCYMAMTCFCLDYRPRTFGDRHTFKHRIGNAYVESLAQPEAAVGYTEAFLFESARRAGFSDARILHGETDVQHLLLCRR
jgi:SAM-dependent methyltransferase